ncbi:hypothetical protein S40293_11469 [Stachybotrys chartarum IBT 40293]|nr:hypothetical protein S40293_11469 [Stachybotrys chartarum IBT 40293]
MEVTVASTLAGTSVGPQKALEDAVDGFHSILTREQRDRLGRIGAIRDAETVMIFIAQLDRENQLRKGRGVASRLISVLQSVQAFSTVVDTFVSAIQTQELWCTELTGPRSRHNAELTRDIDNSSTLAWMFLQQLLFEHLRQCHSRTQPRASVIHAVDAVKLRYIDLS